MADQSPPPTLRKFYHKNRVLAVGRGADQYCTRRTGLNVKYDWVGLCAILSHYDAWLWTDYGKGESGHSSYSRDRDVMELFEYSVLLVSSLPQVLAPSYDLLLSTSLLSVTRPNEEINPTLSAPRPFPEGTTE